MVLLISILIILATALILWGILGLSQASARRTLPQVSKKKEIRIYSFISSIFPFSQRLLEKLKLEAKIKTRLDAAHIKLAANEFFNLKLALMFLLALVALFGLGKLGPMALIIGLALGYIIPDFFVSRKINQRKQMVARLLPETVDLLGLCVEAGLDFTTAVKWIIEKTPNNPMIEELTFVLEEIKWGKSRSQALKDMSRRLNIPEVVSFVQTLVQAERMGTPVAEAFSILSEDSRLQRFNRGERFALQAPIKILIPLIFCILPVIAIVIGGPIFLQFTQGGLLKGMGG